MSKTYLHAATAAVALIFGPSLGRLNPARAEAIAEQPGNDASQLGEVVVVEVVVVDEVDVVEVEVVEVDVDVVVLVERFDPSETLEEIVRRGVSHEGVKSGRICQIAQMGCKPPPSALMEAVELVRLEG